MQQTRSYAATLLAAHGVTRLDILNYITHGVSKVPHAPAPPPSPAGEGQEGEGARQGDDESHAAADPLAAYAVNLTERASAGKLDPLVGRTVELNRTLEILCRRCALAYPVRDEIPVMLVDEARPLGGAGGESSH
jgi:ATP-dependent Clp protease ATP-binding subunit ClpA